MRAATTSIVCLLNPCSLLTANTDRLRAYAQQGTHTRASLARICPFWQHYGHRRGLHGNTALRALWQALSHTCS